MDQLRPDSGAAKLRRPSARNPFARILPAFVLIVLASCALLAAQQNNTVPADQAPPPTQQVAPAPAPIQAPSRPAVQLAPRPVTLVLGRGELQQFTDSVSRVAVSEPLIADAVVISPHEVVLNAKSVGNTTILIWHGESVSRFELTVQPDLSEIQRELRATLPNEQINVSSSKDSILLTGVASSPEVVRRAGEIASAHSKTVVNLLQAPKTDPRQVMLQVKFASVDRDALNRIGVNIFSTNNKLVGSLTTQQFSFPRLGQLQLQQGPQGQPVLGSQQVTVSDLLNLFAFRPDLNVGATIAMLQSRNVLEILAEPNLIAVSGHEASFLAGGEFPFPVITTTGTGGNSAPVVTVQFRPFGVRLKFTPTVDANDVIHLKVEPEVSSLDFANGLTIQGFLIPAISTRRADTEVDLREGESFAIAGLIDNRVTQVLSKIPGLGDIPILGQLFKTRQTEKTNSELLVLITPRFVKPFASGEKVPLPHYPVKLLDGQRPDQAPAPPKFVGPRGHESSPAPGGGPAK